MDAKFLVLSMKEPGATVGVREYHKRKHHTKDRLGCSSCKQRRVRVRYRIPRFVGIGELLSTDPSLV